MPKRKQPTQTFEQQFHTFCNTAHPSAVGMLLRFGDALLVTRLNTAPDVAWPFDNVPTIAQSVKPVARNGRKKSIREALDERQEALAEVCALSDKLVKQGVNVEADLKANAGVDLLSIEGCTLDELRQALKTLRDLKK